MKENYIIVVVLLLLLLLLIIIINASKIVAGKPKGKRPLGRPRYRWVDNIKMDLKRDKIGWYRLD
jgi:hypothetical protein